MLTKTKIAMTALLVAGPVTAASAQTYEPTGTYQSLWVEKKPETNAAAPAARARNPNAAAREARAQVPPRQVQRMREPMPYGAYGPTPYDAYAYAGPAGYGSPYIGYGNPYVVYEAGQLVGQDPDPNVRTMLRRDFTFQ